MKELISTIAVVTDASKPSETHKILFKDINTKYDVTTQSEILSMNSYKVIDDNTGEYEPLEAHARPLDKATADALVASLTIASTDYTDIRNEQICKGIAKVIGDEGIFGLTTAQLTIR